MEEFDFQSYDLNFEYIKKRQEKLKRESLSIRNNLSNRDRRLLKIFLGLEKITAAENPFLYSVLKDTEDLDVDRSAENRTVVEKTYFGADTLIPSLFLKEGNNISHVYQNAKSEFDAFVKQWKETETFYIGQELNLEQKISLVRAYSHYNRIFSDQLLFDSGKSNSLRIEVIGQV